MKKIVWLLVVIIALVYVTYLFVDLPNSEIVQNTNISSATTTISGVFECLPHVNKDGPQTLECAFGIKSDDGKNYALDLSSMPNSSQDLPMQKHFSVTGLLTPIEMINSNVWQRYDMKGIIKVFSFTELDIKSSPANSKFTIGLNESMLVGGTSIKVWAVIEDSRCASDVTCVWAGRVRLASNVGVSSNSQTIEFEIGKTVNVGNLAITLENVSPYPISTKKIQDDEYKFTFNVKDRSVGNNKL